MAWKPEDDGITHINVYSKGKTALGKWLSNFTRVPIETEDGHFESIEGYWYWLGTNDAHKDELRYASGWQAKSLGREMRGVDWQSDDEFKRKICAAIKIKIESNPKMLLALQENTLPLTHYYVYGENHNNPKVVEPKDGKWVIDFISELGS